LKTILFIADGMADRLIRELNWKTPLEAANKPSLNEVATNGLCGIMDIISPLDESSEVKLTAEILNELTAKFQEVLGIHPVNKESKA
jgi:2,3-bisphosphoglycerate-independent phosphoglycerate mutase